MGEWILCVCVCVCGLDSEEAPCEYRTGPFGCELPDQLNDCLFLKEDWLIELVAKPFIAT
jgi:hypothetical protein